MPGPSDEAPGCAVVECQLAPSASRAAASAGCQNTRQGQQLASGHREHRSQCNASVWWTNWQAARPWPDSSHAGLDLLGADGQRAPNLASRAAVGAKQEPGSGFFVVSLLFAPEILGSCAQFAPFCPFRSCVVRNVSFCRRVIIEMSGLVSSFILDSSCRGPMHRIGLTPAPRRQRRLAL